MHQNLAINLWQFYISKNSFIVFVPECPNLVAQEENANLDFAEKFVRPTAFTIPVNDLFFKHKRCTSEKEDNEEEIKGRTFLTPYIIGLRPKAKDPKNYLSCCLRAKVKDLGFCLQSKAKDLGIT